MRSPHNFTSWGHLLLWEPVLFADKHPHCTEMLGLVGFSFWRNDPNFNNLLHYRGETNDEICQGSGWNTVFPMFPWKRKQRNIGEQTLFLIGKLTSQKSLVQNVKFDVGYRYEHWFTAADAWTYRNYSKVNLVTPSFQLYHGCLVLAQVICDLTIEGNEERMKERHEGKDVYTETLQGVLVNSSVLLLMTGQSILLTLSIQLTH